MTPTTPNDLQRNPEENRYHMRPLMSASEVPIKTRMYWLDSEGKYQLPPLTMGGFSNQKQNNRLPVQFPSAEMTNLTSSTSMRSSVSSNTMLIDAMQLPFDANFRGISECVNNLNMLADVTASTTSDYQNELTLKYEQIVMLSDCLKRNLFAMEDATNFMRRKNDTYGGSSVLKVIQPLNQSVSAAPTLTKMEVGRFLLCYNESAINEFSNLTRELQTQLCLFHWMSSLWQKDATQTEAETSVFSETTILEAADGSIIPKNISYRYPTNDNSSISSQPQAKVDGEVVKKGEPLKNVRKNANEANRKVIERKKRIAKNLASQDLQCQHCGETETPEWRKGPYGSKSICNACGLFYKKLKTKFGTDNAAELMKHRLSKGESLNRVVPSSIAELETTIIPKPSGAS